MKLKIRLLTVLSLFLICLSCDDEFDGVYQDTDESIRSKLIQSIEFQYLELPGETYGFVYEDDENRLKSISHTGKNDNTSNNPSSEESDKTPVYPIELKYDESDGKLTNFVDIKDHIFYLDLIFNNPYKGKIFDFSVTERDQEENPTLITMYYQDVDGGIVVVKVEISYDLAPNPFYTYLLSGKILDAANEKATMGDRAKLFTESFLPDYNPKKVVYKNQVDKTEHMYIVDYNYNDKMLPTSGDITYFDFTQDETEPEEYKIILNYVNDED